MAESATNPQQIHRGIVVSSGVPTDEEVAAIMAALEVAMPRAVVVAGGEEGPPAWRFAGRWWRKPVAARRERPW